MIVRLDLEGARPAVANVDDAGILPRTLQNALAPRRQAPQVNPRRLVGTVLAPHHAEYAEFRQRGLALSKKLLDPLVFVESEAMLPEGLRRESRSHGGGHGGTLLSHLAGRLGRANFCHFLPDSQLHPPFRPGRRPPFPVRWRTR